MKPLAHIKIFTTFALLHSINGVNHRIYRIPHKRLGVVYPNSYNTVISECSNFGRATLSLFLMIIKFFTNATLSKKFSSREQQYLDANGNSTTRSQCNYFSVHGLFFRGVSAVLRTHAAQTHSAQYYSAGKGFKIYFGLDKRRCFFGQGENFTQALIGLVQDMHYRIEA